MGTASHFLFEDLGTTSKPVNSKERDLSVPYEATMVELDLLALLEQEVLYYPLLIFQSPWRAAKVGEMQSPLLILTIAPVVAR